MQLPHTVCLGFALAALLLVPWPTLAHKGGVDQYGCHTNDKVGGYHCHKGVLAGLSFRSRRDLLDAVDQPRRTPQDPPPAPQVSPPVFEPLTICAVASADEQRACFRRVAPPRD